MKKEREIKREINGRECENIYSLSLYGNRQHMCLAYHETSIPAQRFTTGMIGNRQHLAPSQQIHSRNAIRQIYFNDLPSLAIFIKAD